MAWDNRQQAMPGFSQYGTLGTRRRFPLVTRRTSEDLDGGTKPPSLVVRVTLKFEDPVKVDYSRIYEVSRDFQATEKVRQGLLRRLEHCSTELITRKDPDAMATNDTSESRHGKLLRFQMAFQVDGAGIDQSTAKSYSSYQKQPISMSSAREVILAADRMVGQFLRHHDKNFKWIDGPIKETFSTTPNTVRPCIGSPVSLCCIPRSRFLEQKQEYEFIPGYELELTFRSRCTRRKVPEWTKDIRVSSQQSTPMTLSVGEDAIWNVSRALHHALDKRKMNFDSEHRKCGRNDGPGACQHLEAGALDIGFRIRNCLGPEYEHLSQRIESKLALFCHPDALDCLEFAHQVEQALITARNEADEQLGRTDDLRLAIQELCGRGWTISRPFTISLDSSLAYSRRTTEAILDRVQAGIADVLHGNDVTITLTAHKRGHLILDKTLIAHEIASETTPGYPENSQRGKEWFLAQLKHRIQADIAMVITDTCSLTEEQDDRPKNLRLIEHVSSTPAPTPVHAKEMDSAPPCKSVTDSIFNENKPTELDGRPVGTSEDVGQDETLCGGGRIETVGDANGHNSTNEPLPETPAKAAPRIRGDDGFGGYGSRRSTGFSITDYEESIPFSTPSLIESVVATPHDSSQVTPYFLRTAPGTPEPFGIILNLHGDEMPDYDIAEDSLISDHQRPAMEASKKEPRRFSLLGRNAPKPRPIDAERTAVDTNGPGTLCEGWLEYCCEPVTVDEEPNTMMEENKESQALDLDSDERNQQATPQMEGWLEYCVESVASDDEGETEQDCGITNKDQARSEPLQSDHFNEHVEDSDYFFEQPEEPRLTPIEGSPKAPSFLVLTGEESFPWTDNVQSTLEDEAHPSWSSSKKETPEPTTPPLTLDPEDSDYSSLADPFPFQDLHVSYPPHDTPTPLSLWSQTRPPYIPDDSDSEPETAPTLKPPRPQLARPQTALAFSRPQLHKRQISSPTAGLLGLRDEQQRVEVGLRNALVGSLGAGLLQRGPGGRPRGQSRVLTSLKYEKGVVPVDRRRDGEGRAWTGLSGYTTAQILQKS